MRDAGEEDRRLQTADRRQLCRELCRELCRSEAETGWRLEGAEQGLWTLAFCGVNVKRVGELERYECKSTCTSIGDGA